ncbi:MAG TPA: biopolymer transporter ExbD [Gemmatimonadales bacterium]|jgi:biopolymer transport protein ExbD|nr:biopolymer transporter ExbD [Gemmatimonadales bacterium]
MAMGGGKKDAVVAANINVTPMIDVMLVLLIIFMIVTPAITAGFQATVPRAMNPESKEEDEGEIRLGIDKDGAFFLDITDPRTGKYTGPRRISDEDLPGQLVTLYATRSIDKVLFLKADQDIQYSRVQEAIEIARKAGVRVIGAIAEQQRTARTEEH